MRKICLLSLTFLIFISCSEKKPEVKIIEKKDSAQKNETQRIEIQKDTLKKDTASGNVASGLETNTKSFKTSSGKTFKIVEKKKSASVSDFEISGTGFKDFNKALEFKEKDPMLKAFTGDLNDDGFDELYIVTRSAGAGSYGNILGVASINDNSYAIMNVAEIRDKQLSQSGTFSGYMGRDSIYLTPESIGREFPVYQQTDAMNNPTGGKRIVVYGLKFNNGNYDLVVVNSFYMKEGK